MMQAVAQRFDLEGQLATVPLKVKQWIPRMLRVGRKHEVEALRQQLAEQSLKLEMQAAHMEHQAARIAELDQELNKFGPLRGQVGEIEPELCKAAMPVVCDQLRLAENALKADLRDELDASAFENESLSIARLTACALFETAINLGEQKKSS